MEKARKLEFKTLSDFRNYNTTFASPGLVAEVKEDNSKYMFSSKREWNKLEKGKGKLENFEMSNFEINQQVYSQMNSHVPSSKDAEIINDFYKKENASFYMLLCTTRKIPYFTLLAHKENLLNSSLGQIVIECLSSIGEVIAIERVNNALEIWMWESDTKESNLYILFNYSEGVEYFS